jgi:long-chain acyl-CoA synthetase
MDKPWLEKYDEGVPHTIAYPHRPLYHFLEQSAQMYADKPCTVFQGAVITFKEMDQITDRLAAALVDMGIEKGDRVGIFMPNIPQFVMAYFAILKAGGVVVAINPSYTPAEIVRQAMDAGIEVMFVMSMFYKTLKAAQPRTGIKKLIVTNLKETLPALSRLLFTLLMEKKGGHRIEGGLAEGEAWLQDLVARFQPADRPRLDIGPDDTAMFQYSGGTTGVSKAAVASHANVEANVLMLKSWMTELDEGNEVVLMAIPLFHVYGMVAGMLFGIASGASMVMVVDGRKLKDVLANIAKYRATLFPGVPTLYNAVNNHPDVIAGKYDLSPIKICISGSAPLMRETKDRFEALTGGKLVEGYGLSETPTATHANPILGENRIGSIGLPLPDIDCKIVSLDDGETEMAPGEIGELIIHGPVVMQGYHNMPTETANTLRTLPDGNVWLFTGDIVRMDEDGYFYIVDRKKDVIKPGGFQVWPREVEEVLSLHPKVLECGVGGIPDPYRGETVKAWIVLKPGESATKDELKSFCKEQLTAYKVPTHFEFRDELPKTTVGKILRRELVREHREAT